MIHYLVIIVISLVIGFVAGLLVGRKNPAVANTAESLAQGAEKLAAQGAKKL